MPSLFRDAASFLFGWTVVASGCLSPLPSKEQAWQRAGFNFGRAGASVPVAYAWRCPVLTTSHLTAHFCITCRATGSIIAWSVIAPNIVSTWLEAWRLYPICARTFPVSSTS